MIPKDSPEWPEACKQQREWQLGRLAEDEAALAAAGVPSCYWIYIGCNSDPKYERPGCHLGTWWDKRTYAENDIAQSVVWHDFQRYAIYYAVADGRDAENIKHYIRESWSDYDMDVWWKEWRAKVDRN